MKKLTWYLEDHLCKSCGGRILRCASGGGPTPGGNPIYRCADCGRSSSGMGPEVICWCGFEMRGQHASAYRCVPFSAIKERPELADMLGACGCDPKRGTSEVGIVLERDFRSNKC